MAAITRPTRNQRTTLGHATSVPTMMASNAPRLRDAMIDRGPPHRRQRPGRQQPARHLAARHHERQGDDEPDRQVRALPREQLRARTGPRRQRRIEEGQARDRGQRTQHEGEGPHHRPLDRRHDRRRAGRQLVASEQRVRRERKGCVVDGSDTADGLPEGDDRVRPLEGDLHEGDRGDDGGHRSQRGAREHESPAQGADHHDGEQHLAHEDRWPPHVREPLAERRIQQDADEERHQRRGRGDRRSAIAGVARDRCARPWVLDGVHAGAIVGRRTRRGKDRSRNAAAANVPSRRGKVIDRACCRRAQLLRICAAERREQPGRRGGGGAATRAGVTVGLFATRTDDLEADRLYRARCAIRVATKQGASPLADIRAFEPDVVHVHNLFPNLGRRWVADVAVPVVATVHNFRFVCAAATLLRDGRVCTDCVDRRPWPGLRHRCYRGSLLATAPLTLSLRSGAAADPVLRSADRVLCLSPRQRALLEAAGLDGARLVDWANFLPEDLDPSPGGRVRPASERVGCVVVGRLTPEKGVADLVGCWTGDTVLRVIGDGPDRGAVERAAGGRPVEVVGRLDRGAAIEEIARSRAVVLPGRWPEVAPLSYLEALAAGTAVVVADTSDLAPGIVADGVGAAVRELADVPAAVDRLAADAGLAARARELFEERHTEASWGDRALRLYGALADGAPLVAPALRPARRRRRARRPLRH